MMFVIKRTFALLLNIKPLCKHNVFQSRGADKQMFLGKDISACFSKKKKKGKFIVLQSRVIG